MKADKKYIAITGASAGIGFATAKAFAKRGRNLILIARRQTRLEALKKEIASFAPSVDVVIKACDLSLAGAAQQLYEDLRPYFIETWINNAGFGIYSHVDTQDLSKTQQMLRLNIEALTVLSTLYARNYKDKPGTQLINISSRGGYTIVPNAVTYCASKFYVSAFTEGLAHELKASQAQLQAKVLAPAATQTEFGKVANDVAEYDYNKRFGAYHTSEQVADFLLQLYDGDKVVGEVNSATFEFRLRDAVFAYSGNAAHNQK